MRAPSGPEPKARRARTRVEPTTRHFATLLSGVVASVVEDIRDSVLDLARRGQHVIVVAVGEHASGATELAVDAPGDTDQEPLHAAAQTPPIVSLAQEVDVVGHDRELDDAKARPLASVHQRPFDRAVATPSAERAETLADAGRDVHGVVVAEVAADAMGDAGASAVRLAAGALAASSATGTVCWKGEVGLLGLRIRAAVPGSRW